MMASTHSIKVLYAGSHYAGCQCPVTKTELKPEERFIVCHKNDGAFSWAALPDLGGQCPYCGQQIDLGQVLTSSGKAHPSKSAQPDKDKKRQPRPKSGHLPSPWRRGLSLPMIALIAILSLGLIGVCSAGAVLGYRQFLAQSTIAPTTGPVVAWTTEAPAAMEPTAVSSSAVEVSSPTNTPRPTPIPPTKTPEPSPTTHQLVVAYQSISLGTGANASLDFVSPPTGKVTLAGVPFQLSNSVFKSQASPSPHNSYPTSILLSVDIPQAYRVHLLLNAGNGFNQFNGQVIGKVLAYCSGSSTFVANLQLGRDIREWHVADNVVSVASRPQQVWTGALSNFPNLTGHIDMLSLDLPERCQNGRLTALEVIDTSTDTTGSLDPALNLVGITVEYYR